MGFFREAQLWRGTICPLAPLLNEEAGYKSAIAGPIFRDFAWHFKMESRGEKASLSLSHSKPLPIHIFIGLTIQKSKKKYP